MKKYLEKLISKKEKEAEEIRQKVQSSENIEEVRSLGNTLQSVLDELNEAKTQLTKLEEDEKEEENKKEEKQEEQEETVIEGRSFNPLKSYIQKREKDMKENYLDSLEYREAFKTYVQTGKWEYRSDAVLTTSDIGKIIPNTIMNELIRELSVYGQLYSKVRKLNIQGGVEFPISDLVPEVRWITETTVSETQKAPEVKTSVVFGYHIAEARISQTLLSSVVSLPVLESEIAKLLSEAFVKEFDNMIVNGSGSGQPLGILNDSRVLSTNKINFTEAEAANWIKYRTKFFAKIPLAYQRGGVFICTSNTWESVIMTLRDTNNRPLYSETYNAGGADAEGGVTRRFAGREVILVEPDILKDFDVAEDGDTWAIYLKPTDYAINSNLQIGFKRYFNEDTNKYINKGLCILDGKLLDVNGVYLLKKEVASQQAEQGDPVEQGGQGE